MQVPSVNQERHMANHMHDRLPKKMMNLSNSLNIDLSSRLTTCCGRIRDPYQLEAATDLQNSTAFLHHHS